MLKINKKINYLLKVIRYVEDYHRLLIVILDLSIFIYCILNLDKEENLIYWLGIILTTTIGILLKIITKEIIVDMFLYKLLKNEYIKANKEIEYLKYVPKEQIEYIEEYIVKNKKILEEKLEFEKLKNNISNF